MHGVAVDVLLDRVVAAIFFCGTGYSYDIALAIRVRRRRYD